MKTTKKLSDGTTVNANIHGRPKGARKTVLTGGYYYLKRDNYFFVYNASGEFETAVRSKEQAETYADRKSKGEKVARLAPNTKGT